MWFAQARACGEMLLRWSARKTEFWASALTFINWVQGPRKTYLLPQIQEAIESLDGAGDFSCLDLKAGF